MKWLNVLCLVCWIFLITLCCVNAYPYDEPCPDECRCYTLGNKEGINCSSLGINQLPELFNLNIKWLDLSDNHFTEIPPNIQHYILLEILYMNENYISNLNENSLDGLVNLSILYLNKNNITNWSNINSNTILLPAINLNSLYLNENPIITLFGTDENSILQSSSLKKLSLDMCSITKITDPFILKGLPNIEHLTLNNNPIRNLPDLVTNLRYLDISNVGLELLQPSIFSNMPKLIGVDLSRNHRLSLRTIVQNEYETVYSSTLKKINLSNCNMNNIELDGFQYLTNVILQRNMIGHLNRDSFRYNKHLENIDLSYNSITNINADTFRGIKQLKNLDLSYNMIRKIERDTFRYNDILININLSKNYLIKFNRFYSKSLTLLNLSGCEILSIDSDALNSLPHINEINLSHNFMSVIPDGLNSESLQILDLSMCRITSIRNETFQNFPELTKIYLSGNRLINPLRREFFEDNPALEELYIGDNPWFCDCEDTSFFDFYTYFVNSYNRIADRENLRCAHPEETYGLTWEVACFPVWYPERRELSKAEKAWTFSMLAIIVLCGSICCMMSVRRCIEGRKLTLREAERQSFLEEQRDVMRENRMRMDQEAALNAPDPRESSPPCYEDALLLPRLKNKFASMDELSAHADKQNDEKTEGIGQRPKTCRCRSEEIIHSRSLHISESIGPDINELIQRSSIRPQIQMSNRISDNDISEITENPIDPIQVQMVIETPSCSNYTENTQRTKTVPSPYTRRKISNPNLSNNKQHTDTNEIEIANELNIEVHNPLNNDNEIQNNRINQSGKSPYSRRKISNPNIANSNKNSINSHPKQSDESLHTKNCNNINNDIKIPVEESIAKSAMDKDADEILVHPIESSL